MRHLLSEHQFAKMSARGLSEVANHYSTATLHGEGGELLGVSPPPYTNKHDVASRRSRQKMSRVPNSGEKQKIRTVRKPVNPRAN